MVTDVSQSARRAGADVHLPADVRAVPLDVAHDARASAVGACTRDERRAAQLLVASEAVAQRALRTA